MLKQVFHPSLGRNIKFGRKRPVAQGPRLQLSKYLRLSLPAAPASCDYTGKAASELANIYGNDTLGDCVIAGGYHIVGVETGNAGTMYTASSSTIIKDYSAIGGYVPGDPSTDQGCDEQTALNYWTQHGFADGTKLLGALSVDPTNKAEVMAAMYLFENLFFGLELPDPYVNPFPSGNGFTWDVAGNPDPENGHCIIGGGYSTAGVLIDTWGMIGTFTWAAIAKYCASKVGGNLYVMLTPDQLTKGQAKAPNGVNWSDLITDFDSIGGNVPVPAPVPTPPAPTPPAPTPVIPPTPVPIPPAPVPALVTLAQAQAWAISNLRAGHTSITRAQAELSVTKALAANWPKH